MLLAGDIGGTKTNLAIFSDACDVLAAGTFPSGQYDSLEALITTFCAGIDFDVDRASLGVAGPVEAGQARGGLYLGGGIPRRILPALESGLFLQAFRRKGRMSEILDRVPVRVILNTKAPLLGAARYGLAGEFTVAAP